eukprot:scaffold320342_cov28-Tisochrysis_lutea.AAC.2
MATGLHTPIGSRSRGSPCLDRTANMQNHLHHHRSLRHWCSKCTCRNTLCGTMAGLVMAAA